MLWKRHQIPSVNSDIIWHDVTEHMFKQLEIQLSIKGLFKLLSEYNLLWICLWFYLHLSIVYTSKNAITLSNWLNINYKFSFKCYLVNIHIMMLFSRSTFLIKLDKLQISRKVTTINIHFGHRVRESICLPFYTSITPQKWMKTTYHIHNNNS